MIDFANRAEPFYLAPLGILTERLFSELIEERSTIVER